MIDPNQPPPGWSITPMGNVIKTLVGKFDNAGAHRIYAAESRPAVIDFAERIASWLAYDIHPLHDAPTSQAWHEWASSGSTMLYREWRDAQILAAARGERTLP